MASPALRGLEYFAEEENKRRRRRAERNRMIQGNSRDVHQNFRLLRSSTCSRAGAPEERDDDGAAPPPAYRSGSTVMMKNTRTWRVVVRQGFGWIQMRLNRRQKREEGHGRGWARAEHKLQAHENDDDIAAQQEHPGEADSEEQSAHRQKWVSVGAASSQVGEAPRII